MKKIKKFELIAKDFGIRYAIRYSVYLKSGMTEKCINLLYDNMTNILSPIIKNYNLIQHVTDDKEQYGKEYIWVCWWQGFDSMPELCRMCWNHLNSVISSKYKLILITKDNYKEYVKIPNFIINKMKSGIISITQFSDILREGLLAQKGGTWIDASVLVTGDLLKYIDNDLPFWSVKLDHVDNPKVLGQAISQCQWSGFLFSGYKENIVSKFVFDSMCLYFDNFSSTDYFIQNMIIRVGYDNVPDIRTIIDSIPVSNPHLYDLYKCIDTPFSMQKWNELCENTGAFKLTQKRKYEIFSDGKETFYGFLLNNC